jgi:tRNA U55 pseudouridine synthase TruB
MQWNKLPETNDIIKILQEQGTSNFNPLDLRNQENKNIAKIGAKAQKIINENFLGTIKQTPPKKSRVKRQERERDIMRFELLEVSENKKDFLFISEVQGGTYIRKLCSDLGEKIEGAHMLELRRTKAGIFDETQVVKLYDFDKAVEEYKNGNSAPLEKIIIPAEDGIRKVMECYEAKAEVVYKLKTGKPIFRDDLEGLSPQEGDFALFCKEKFIGLYRLTNESTDILARPTFVFT